MKCIDISFDFDAVKMNEKEREFITRQGFAYSFEALFNQAFSAKYPSGADRAKGRVLSRLQRAFDSMAPSDKVLKVEEAEFDLIKEVFLDEKASFQTIQYRLVNTILEHIEAAAASKCCESNGECKEAHV